MNRFIAEKVMKVCWHEPEWNVLRACADGRYGSPCSKCHNRVEPTEPFHPDYTTPADYFALLQFAIGSSWWKGFDEFAWMNRTSEADKGSAEYIKWLLAPENFARLVAEYHGWKGEK